MCEWCEGQHFIQQQSEWPGYLLDVPMGALFLCFRKDWHQSCRLSSTFVLSASATLTGIRQGHPHEDDLGMMRRNGPLHSPSLPLLLHLLSRVYPDHVCFLHSFLAAVAQQIRTRWKKKVHNDFQEGNKQPKKKKKERKRET